MDLAWQVSASGPSPAALAVIHQNLCDPVTNFMETAWFSFSIVLSLRKINDYETVGFVKCQLFFYEALLRVTHRNVICQRVKKNQLIKGVSCIVFQASDRPVA